jgi:hypothetical protein
MKTSSNPPLTCHPEIIVGDIAFASDALDRAIVDGFLPKNDGAK